MTRRGLVSSFVLLLCVSGYSAHGQTAVSGQAIEEASRAIDAASARSTVEWLCRPELRGRGSINPGFMIAADKMARELKGLGFQPLTGDGFVLPFDSSRREWKKFSAGPAIITTPVHSANVVGWIPGTTREVVIVGAHLDHIGFDPEQPEVFAPGADDNASGVAAVLEMAKAVSQYRRAGSLERGVVIAFWGAEELGLLGSQSFVGGLQADFNQFRMAGTKGKMRFPFSLTDIALVVNLDMVGRRYDEDDPAAGGRKSVMVIGADGVTTADGLKTKDAVLAGLLASAQAADAGLTFRYDDGGEHYFSRTDTYSFVQARNDLATLFLCGPEHDDYHSPTDTPEKLDYDRLVRIARLAFRVAVAVADSGLQPTCEDCLAKSK